MKKTITILLLILIVPILCHGMEIKETSIAWESGLKPPYLMLDANKNPTGIAVDILNEIFTRKNITVKQIVMPWKRCLKYIQTKRIDIVPNSSFIKERTEYAFYTDPLYETHLVLYYKKSRFSKPPKISSVKDLKRYKVGGVLGFNYTQYKGIIDIYTGAHSRANLIKMLKADRVDFAVLQKEVMLAKQKTGEVDLSDLASIPDPAQPVKSFHILTIMSPKGKELKTIIDDGIKEFTNDGTIRLINTKYLEK